MVKIYFLIIFLLLYLIWFLYGKIIFALKNFLKNNVTTKVFDLLLVSFLIALLISRLGYIMSNWYFYKQFGFSFLPYIRFKGHISFLEYFPWRVLRFNEGIDRILLYIMWLILSILLIPFKLLVKYRQIVLKGNIVKLRVVYIYALGVIIFLFISIAIWGMRIISYF